MVEDTMIGIDVGTTAIKALLLTLDGKRLDQLSQPYPTARPASGIVEQDANDWFAHVTAALGRFERNFDLRGLQGIGICSQVNTHVFAGADHQPLAPAIVWQDGRTAGVAADLDRRIDMAKRVEWWGAPLPIDASHCLSRIVWMQAFHPEIWQKTRWVMAPKDYCVLRLTGEAAADPIASIGLVGRDLAYLEPLLDMVPGSEARLPPLRKFTDCVGRVRDGLPCAGAPVVVGAMDAWGGMFGVGVHAPGHSMYLSGTSEIPGIVSPTVMPTPGVIVFPTYEGITLHAGPTQSGGASMAWLGNLLGMTPEELAGLAGELPADAAVPIFLPHLQGERAPLWDAHARGVFVGLDSATGPAHLARSVMEGVGYSVRLSMDSLEASAGRRVDQVHCGGGGFQSDVWNQVRADILGRTLRRVAISDAAALGAATIAAVGCGVHDSIAGSVGAIVQFDREYHPDPARAARHDFGFGLYKETYEVTKGISRKYSDHHA